MHRKIAVSLAALALVTGLAGCGALGSGSSAGSGEPGASASAPSESECALLRTALDRASARADGLPQKLQSDVPGAIADINATIDDFQALTQELPEGQLKTQVDQLVKQAEELRALLEEAQQSGANGFTAVAQASSKLGEIYTTLESINASCAAAR